MVICLLDDQRHTPCINVQSFPIMCFITKGYFKSVKQKLTIPEDC